jgi:hypothetical protein
MTTYRIYAMDVFGRIRTGVDATCESDEAAFRHARIVLNPGERGVIWDGLRCLGMAAGPQEVAAGQPQGGSAREPVVLELRLPAPSAGVSASRPAWPEFQQRYHG